MGILDDVQKWGLGLLNGGAMPAQGAAQAAPFGFAMQQPGTYPTAFDNRQGRLGRQGLPLDKATDFPTALGQGAARSLATLPQRAMDAAQESVAHNYGPGPASINDWEDRWQDPLPKVGAETALMMMGGAGLVPAEAGALRSGFTTIPRVVSSKEMQKAVLKNEWSKTGADLDYNAMEYDDALNNAFNRHTALWNKQNGTNIDPNNYNLGSNRDFERAFEAAHLDGKKSPFPGVRAANDFYESNDELHRGAYLPGQEP